MALLLRRASLSIATLRVLSDLSLFCDPARQFDRRGHQAGPSLGTVNARREAAGAARLRGMEKMDPESPEWGYIGRKAFASKLWAPAAASPFLTEHLKSFVDYPPRQKADSLSAKAAIDRVQKMLQSHN